MSLRLFADRIHADSLYAVVGLGLLGSRIAQQLSWHCQPLGSSSYADPLNWQQPQQIATQLLAILDHYPDAKLDIIWSAGKAGFAADEQQMSREYDAFAMIMTTLASQQSRLCINFLSSAGGLYENSGRVRHIDDLSPSRPYGHCKLRQEQLLSQLALPARIYRISSVYGPSNGNMRSGLINHLVNCARHGNTITIYANQNTLRDYIHSNDVARYVASSVLNNHPVGVEILASGRATSINTLVNMTANITHWPVKVTFVASHDNSSDIVFDGSLLPASLAITSLEEGIRLLKHDRADSPV